MKTKNAPSTKAAAKKIAAAKAAAANAEAKVKLDGMLAAAEQDGTPASLLAWHKDAAKSPLYVKGLKGESHKAYRLAEALANNQKAIAELTADVQPIIATDESILKLDAGRALSYYLLGAKAQALKLSVGHSAWLPLLTLLKLPERTISRSLKVFKLWRDTPNAKSKLSGQPLKFAVAGPEPKPHVLAPMEEAIKESNLLLNRKWHIATARITDAVIADEEANAVSELISRYGDEKILTVVAKWIFDRALAEKKPAAQPDTATN